MPHLSILTDDPGLSMTRGGDRLRATSVVDLIHVALVDVEEDGSAGQGGGGIDGTFATSWGNVNGARANLHMGVYVDAVDAKRDVPYDLERRDWHGMAYNNAHMTTGIGRRRRGGIDDHGAAVLEESIGGGGKEEDNECKEEYFY
jgi:hypothetical protein